MDAKCFECGAMVEADGLDALCDAFLIHGLTAHAWTYPEQAVRNYARNYAEAVMRLSGGSARLKTIGDVAVHPVTDRIDDWLSFFDHDGFVGNPDWASCYCLEPHVLAPPDMPERPWRDSRSAMAERLRNGNTFGYLAYADGRAAGWVNASLRADYEFFRGIDPDGPPPTSVISVSCFVVAPPYRRHGLASALLDRVVAEAGGRGASWIEGYPHINPKDGDSGHFRGARSMYEARGFAPVVERGNYTVMRRPAT